MSHLFDPGYCREPFLTLCREYPGEDVYPPSQFRVEWGPIFHRGRLDGSARVLILGQDPAQHETVVRRILVGEAGRRVQGFLTKVGITTSYVFINAFLYSVYGSVKAKTKKDPNLITYRNRWIQALLAGGKVEAVVALGQAAEEAWNQWIATPPGATTQALFVPIWHPTRPESSSKGNKSKLPGETKKLLANWNTGLQALAPAIHHPDIPKPNPLVLYGSSWSDADKAAVPELDFPAGLPAWMHEDDGWARRVGATDLAKRRNITITVPKGEVD